MAEKLDENELVSLKVFYQNESAPKDIHQLIRPENP